MPPSEDMPPLPDSDRDLIMHVTFPILGGFKLMGADAPKSMGFSVRAFNRC